MSVNSSTFNICLDIAGNVTKCSKLPIYMCQVNVCLQNNKSEQCSHVRCYFHSAGWHPLFSPMILFLCTN